MKLIDMQPRIILLLIRIEGDWVFRCDFGHLYKIFKVNGQLESSLPKVLQEAQGWMTEQWNMAASNTQ